MDPLLLAEGEQCIVAEVRVRFDLVDRGPDAAAAEQLLQLLGAEVGHADGAHKLGVDEGLHRGPC